MHNDITDLILLVGTSPLPNYITANYIISQNPNIKKVWMVHSDGHQSQASTRKYADNIKNLLIKKLDIDSNLFEYISVKNVENMQAIQNQLSSKLIVDELSEETHIHLNYTGGTKVMSVKAYDYLQNLEGNFRKSYSYLSARSYALRDQNNNSLSEDLRPFISTSIEDMLSLHNYYRLNQPDQYDFSEAVYEIKKMINNNSQRSFYDGWDKSMFYQRNYIVETVDQFNQIKSGINIQRGTFFDIIKKLPENLRIIDNNNRVIAPVDDSAVSASVGFILGKWLEEYVYHLLRKKYNDQNFITIDKNWEISHPDWQGQNKFEIDLMLIRGYQLFGISCTTIKNDKAKIKNKGFEVILRSRQIGGEEAKAILVTRAGDRLRDLLQEELKFETGGKENILVLGQNDLKEENFLFKIKGFLS